MNINDKNFVDEQITNLYKLIHLNLKIILRKITKLLQIYTVKVHYSLHIQIQLERIAIDLEREIKIKQKTNEKLQNRLRNMQKIEKRIKLK